MQSVLSNSPKGLPKNPPDYPIAEELFAKALQSFKTCVLVNNNLFGELFASLESPTTFDESFYVTSVLFFIPDFNVRSLKLDNFYV